MIITDLTKLRGKKFGCIYADPPWLYGNQGTRSATSNHYDGLTVKQLCELPIKDLAAEDAHLHLWTTSGFNREAFDVIVAWGFEYRSQFVWVKKQMGIGNYWRLSHELLLTAIRGNTKKFHDRSLKSWAMYPRTKHSKKPDEVRRMIEKASRGPYLELFGREDTKGWKVWGDEVENNLFSKEG